jgi:hypothetical protein
MLPVGQAVVSDDLGADSAVDRQRPDRGACLRAVRRFGLRVWRILAVPTESFMGGARSVFHLAALGERRECYVPGSANVSPRSFGADAPAGHHLAQVWAEQEAENARLRAVVATFADRPACMLHGDMRLEGDHNSPERPGVQHCIRTT